jgi:hypothetical protein
MADDVGTATEAAAEKEEVRRREARLRRMAASMDLVLRKSRARDSSRMDFGCYRIENKDGCPVSGTYPYPYSLSLDGLEEALDLLAESPPEWAVTNKGRFVHGCAGAADPHWGR